MQPRGTRGEVPVQHQIANEIREQIASGKLQPGDKIPTIRQIREQWDCATTTAQNALAILRSEGRIASGGRGKVPVVRTPPQRINLTLGDRQRMKDLVRKPKAERASVGASELLLGVPLDQTKFIPDYKVITATEELAQEFDIEVGTELLQRTYDTINRETGHTLLWSRSYIPKVLIESNPKLLDVAEEPWAGGHQHQLYTVGIEVDRFETTLTAVMPTAGERQQWGMGDGIPMLVTRSKSIDIRDRVVELSEAYYPADRTAMRFIEQLERW